ncbi:MAG TPA: hypothetical protein VMY87_06130 [Armatimonadota bacterium]|nr:hypothetical protein [Armatimonadota bacterium]
MDLRLDDNQIIPLRYRVLCDLRALPQEFPWPTDARGILAYTAAERDAIAAALDKARLPYTIEAVDQPSPAHVALLQGKVHSRSEALAALAALAAGETPAIPELQLSLIDQRVKDLEIAKEVIDVR